MANKQSTPSGQSSANPADPNSSSVGVDLSYPDAGAVAASSADAGASASPSGGPDAGSASSGGDSGPKASATGSSKSAGDDQNAPKIPSRKDSEVSASKGSPKKSESSLAELSKKLSNWKDDLVKKDGEDTGVGESVNDIVSDSSVGGSPSANDDSADSGAPADLQAANSAASDTTASTPASLASSGSSAPLDLSAPSGDSTPSDLAASDQKSEGPAESAADIPDALSGTMPPDATSSGSTDEPAVSTNTPVYSADISADKDLSSAVPASTGPQGAVSSSAQTSSSAPLSTPAPTPSALAPASPSVPAPTSPATSTSTPTAGAVLTQPSMMPPPAANAPAGKYPYPIEQLLEIVVEKDASDLHVTVGYPAMIRIDGDLQPVSDHIIGEGDIADLVLPVLPENKRELLEVNREVDLAYSFRKDARFRINAFYSKGFVSAALRLIPNNIRSIEELKLPGTYHQIAKLPQGLVLVTGPTGHGKSTTLAAMLQEINANMPKHIITIEDPIEYVYPSGRALVDQREMHEDTHSWEIALRSAMREDPDVVLVGEMRDFETIAAAITLAETGHLVFATLHTNNAAQTIDRVIDVLPEHQQSQVRTQLSNIVEAVIAQRLIPIKGGGRRAVSEILLATPAVRNLIREGKSHQLDNVIRTSLDVGMKTLEHSLVDLVREGVITVDDAEMIAVHPEEITRLLK